MFQVIKIFQTRGMSKHFLTPSNKHTVYIKEKLEINKLNKSTFLARSICQYRQSHFNISFTIIIYLKLDVLYTCILQTRKSTYYWKVISSIFHFLSYVKCIFRLEIDIKAFGNLVFIWLGLDSRLDRLNYFTPSAIKDIRGVIINKLVVS